MKRHLIAVILSLLPTLALASACIGPAHMAPAALPSAGSPTTATPAAAPTAAPAAPDKTKPGKQTQPSATAAPTTATAPAGPIATANPDDFLAPEILGRPTDASVTVNLLPARDVEVYVEYGAQPGAYTGKTAVVWAAAGKPTELVVDGLQPNTRYAYRVRYRSPGADPFSARPEQSFTTQRAPGSTFTFDIQGDSHPERAGKQFDAALYVRTLLAAAADRPDFYMTIGDDFSVDNLKTVNAATVSGLYAQQRQWLGLVAAPVFLVNGNHEQAAQVNLDGTPNNVAVWAQTARNAYFPQPAPDSFYSGDAKPVEFIGQLRDYYAWTWGDALFVVIDPYWHSAVAVDNVFGGGGKTRDLWGITMGDDQYQWFKHTLETSPARYKFVFAHHVNGTGRGGIEDAGSYEWGNAAQFAAHRPGWDKTIQKLMADNHVSIFFQGHDHIFARQQLDGVVYQSLPEPANPFYTLENADTYISGDKLPNSGYVRVIVAPEAAKVEYVRTYLPKDEINGVRSGQVSFSYSVAPGR